MMILSETVWLNRENKRTYRCVAGKDLLGDWFVTRFWGAMDTGCGHFKTTLCPSKERAFVAVLDIGKERQKRGYTKIEERHYA